MPCWSNFLWGLSREWPFKKSSNQCLPLFRKKRQLFFFKIFHRLKIRIHFCRLLFAKESSIASDYRHETDRHSSNAAGMPEHVLYQQRSFLNVKNRAQIIGIISNAKRLSWRIFKKLFQHRTQGGHILGWSLVLHKCAVGCFGMLMWGSLNWKMINLRINVSAVGVYVLQPDGALAPTP